MKIKKLKLGEWSTTGTGVDKFESLTRAEQISFLADNISPSGDTVRAESLLKGVKHAEPKTAKEDKK